MVSGFAAVSLAAAGLVATAGTAGAQVPNTHQPRSNCVDWHDSNTQGVASVGGPYQAWVKCANGRYVFGHAVRNYSWSYAYCTSVHSYRVAGDVSYLQ
ncbi:hypothetical protein DY245_42395 [Streptomyces inhibens]|uniref:Lactococcin 972 family bacteriocin n=1 Tax=Streptomyces inhibens TaxID=2293571 RepID=A0A371PR71_STRIH|nr:hypothetical protein DY245_42395 [Streptomyces inhibens]